MELTVSTEKEGIDEETINEMIKLAKINHSDLLDKAKRTWVLYAVTRYTDENNYTDEGATEGTTIDDIHSHLIEQDDSPFLDKNDEQEKEDIGEVLDNLKKNGQIKKAKDRWMINR